MTPDQHSATDFSRSYRHYVLAMLTSVYMLSTTDQGLVNLLLEPIKEDMHASDSQLGVLTGIVFGLFYSTLGVPVARWADSGNRVTITSIAIGLWGVTVMSCFFVTNFMQLAFARVAAAIGEASCMPPTYSLVGDYFPEASTRASAMGIYMLGNSITVLVSFMLGGWVSAHYGWRMAFFVMGLPGLLLAVLFKVTVREPRLLSTQHDVRGRLPSAGDVQAALWRQRTCRHLCFALILLYTMAFGLWPWYAAFMIRSHGMGTGELGIWLGLIFGVGGMAGTWLGGYVTARWLPHNERAQMRMIAVVTASGIPCCALFLLLPEKVHALAALVLVMVGLNFFTAPTFTLLQRLVRDDMRATTLAVVMFLANLVGLSIGPESVGALSDLLRSYLGNDSLRYAMLLMSLLSVGAAYYFWEVGRTVMEDLAISRG